MLKKLILTLICSINLLSKAQSYPQGLQIKDAAPDFSAVDQYGKTIELKEQLKKGPVVLIFYRGEWCGYCNRQLKSLEDSLGFIHQKGATLLAVTPEQKTSIAKTVEKTKVTFSILGDDNLNIITQYKVGFELDEETTKKYKGYGIDLLESNATNGNNLPIPAVYIINQKGVITYRYFDQNYKRRVSVLEILSNI
jgi:peroxiredoxin